MKKGPPLGELLEEGRRRLRALPFAPPAREAALLLSELLGWSEARVLARTDERVEEELAANFRSLLARREQGEPVAYLFGRREFYGREFEVDRRVLVPRPETEHLIEIALQLELPPAPKIADVGTGSGAIAVTFAAELPQSKVLATDLSIGALTVAQSNARNHGVAARVAFLQTDLLAGIDLWKLDLLVSNPPYIDPAVAGKLSPEVTDFEPHLALFSPQEGKEAIQRLLSAARDLRPGTPILLEIGYDQADFVAAEAQRQGLGEVEISNDYAGLPRNALLRR
jgi:release factor glutamine methyltransferase